MCGDLRGFCGVMISLVPLGRDSLDVVAQFGALLPQVLEYFLRNFLEVAKHPCDFQEAGKCSGLRAILHARHECGPALGHHLELGAHQHHQLAVCLEDIFFSFLRLGRWASKSCRDQ